MKIKYMLDFSKQVFKQIHLFIGIILVTILSKIIFLELKGDIVNILNLILDIVILLLISKIYIEKVKSEKFLFKNRVLEIFTLVCIKNIFKIFIIFYSFIHNIILFLYVFVIVFDIVIVTILATDIEFINVLDFLKFILIKKMKKYILEIFIFISIYSMYHYFLTYIYNFKVYISIVSLFNIILIIFSLNIIDIFYKEYINENK